MVLITGLSARLGYCYLGVFLKGLPICTGTLNLDSQHEIIFLWLSFPQHQFSSWIYILPLTALALSNTLSCKLGNNYKKIKLPLSWDYFSFSFLSSPFYPSMTLFFNPQICQSYGKRNICKAIRCLGIRGVFLHFCLRIFLFVCLLACLF